MLNQTQVIQILKDIPHGKYSTRQIRQFILIHYTLTAKDNKPYTNTRETVYPHWYNVVQKAIYHLKESQLITYISHDLYQF